MLPAAVTSKLAQFHHTSTPQHGVRVAHVDLQIQRAVPMADRRLEPALGGSLVRGLHIMRSALSSGEKSAARGTRHAAKLAQGLKVALCLYGPLDRSSPITWPSIERHVLEPLRSAGATLTIYSFDLRVRPPAKIDGVRPCENRFVPCDECESMEQDQLGEEFYAAAKAAVRRPHRLFADYSKRSWKALQNITHAGADSTTNALRALYSESRVGRWLSAQAGKRDGVDVAVVCSPDLFIANRLSIHDVLIAAGRRPHPDLNASTAARFPGGLLFTTNLNDEQGYTDGFYMGRPSVLAPVLSRLHDLSTLNATRSYEILLKAAVDKRRLYRAVTPLVFFKVRANCYVEWQGIKAWRGGKRFKHIRLPVTKLAAVQRTYAELKALTGPRTRAVVYANASTGCNCMPQAALSEGQLHALLPPPGSTSEDRRNVSIVPLKVEGCPLESGCVYPAWVIPFNVR